MRSKPTAQEPRWAILLRYLIQQEPVLAESSPQVGAAIGALISNARSVQCASLKSNMGHLEACAAAAGLVSLVLVPLGACMIAVNA